MLVFEERWFCGVAPLREGVEDEWNRVVMYTQLHLIWVKQGIRFEKECELKGFFCLGFYSPTFLPPFLFSARARKQKQHGKC